MKYLLILLFTLSMPASAEFIQLINTDTYSQSDYLIEARYRHQRTKPRVIMYSASWCGYCKQARHYFRANRIPFTEYDIERSQSAKRRYNALGGRATPLIIAGRNRINGFSVHHFRRIYRY